MKSKRCEKEHCNRLGPYRSPKYSHVWFCKEHFNEALEKIKAKHRKKLEPELDRIKELEIMHQSPLASIIYNRELSFSEKLEAAEKLNG